MVNKCSRNHHHDDDDVEFCSVRGFIRRRRQRRAPFARARLIIIYNFIHKIVRSFVMAVPCCNRASNAMKTKTHKDLCPSSPAQRFIHASCGRCCVVRGYKHFFFVKHLRILSDDLLISFGID